MNNYASWWNTTVTIYNRYEDPQTQVVVWHRHVIPGCFWKYSGEKVTISAGNASNTVTLDTNTIICRIRVNKKFLEKYEWVKVPNDKMSDYFTLGVGDIIVKGEIEDEINEYTSGKRSTDLKKKYKTLQGCMEIQEFSINTGGNRGNEHYYVRGI